MAKVDEWVANREDRSAVRPCVDLACGVEVWVGDNGAMRIGDCSETIGIDRADIPAFVDWVLDVYGITPTGFERKGGV